MNKLLVGSLALAAVAFGGSAVRAADMPLKAPPPVVYYNWTGCYVGLSVGDSTGRSQYYSRDTWAGGGPGSAITDRFNLSGFIGGAQGGCNYQVSSWVLGVELDGSMTNKSGQNFDLPPVGSAFDAQTNERWLVTARARVGYLVTDKWLWYVTGGGAWASVKASEWAVANPIATKQEETKTLSGWTVGVGTEYAVGYGWSIKSEFLYADFGKKDFFDNPPPAFVRKTVSLNDYIWRVGMNYKFGWSPAVVAKY